jgi:two-component system chemotaxis response regulator CheB
VTKSKLRVVVIDDSPLFVQAMVATLQADGDIDVVGTGGDGLRAVNLVATLRPDLVAMDVQMPVMSGLEAVEQIMATHPTPILLVTSDPAHQGERGVFEALSRGALDIVSKANLDQHWLRDHVRLLSSVPVVYRRRSRPRRPSQRMGFVVGSGSGGVGIVASTGGPPALAEILSRLPPDFPLPIVVVQHLAPGFGASLVTWLRGVAKLDVAIAERGQTIEGGTIYIAPEGAHATIATGDKIVLDSVRPDHDGHRPSGTVLLKSMATTWGKRAIGVVLTGMGADGATGLLAIRRAGGQTIAQDEVSSTVYGMPRVAFELGAADRVLSPPQIAAELVRAARALHSETST